MINRKKSLELTAYGIAMMFGCYWVYNDIIKSYLPFPDSIKSIIGLLCLYVIGLTIFILITKKIPKGTPTKQKMDIKTIILCFLLQFTAILVLSVITQVLINLGINKASVSLEVTSPYMLFMLLIFNPIIEEIVFRKMFADNLIQFGEGFYMLASSFCFAVVHGVSLGIPQVIYTFILGMIWSYLYVKSGHLILVIGMHTLSNLFGSVILQILMNTSMIAAGIYTMLIMSSGVIGLILFLANRQKIWIDGNKGIIKKETCKEIFTNKGIWIYILLTILMMVI